MSFCYFLDLFRIFGLSKSINWLGHLFNTEYRPEISFKSSLIFLFAYLRLPVT